MEVREILQSKLMAKVIIQSGNKIEIVAVFEKSDEWKCFFVFTAKTVKAQQADWKMKSYHGIFAGKHLSLDDFVMNECKWNFKASMKFIDTKLFCSKKEFDLHMDKIAHPHKYAKPILPKGATFDIVNRRNKGGIGSYFNNRNRDFDTLPAPKDEVLVYVDYCEDCMQRHAIAHFPAGNTKCMGFAELKNNPGLVYSHHISGTQTFVFKYRVDMPRSVS